MATETAPLPVLTDRMILEFERPIIDLERKISELRGLSTESVDFSAEIRRLEQNLLREGGLRERMTQARRQCRGN